MGLHGWGRSRGAHLISLALQLLASVAMIIWVTGSAAPAITGTSLVTVVLIALAQCWSVALELDELGPRSDDENTL